MPGHNANFSKIRQGAPLSAVTGAGYHNAIRDVLKWATKEMNRSGRGFSALDFDPGLVLVHNNSGSNRQQYDILGINNYAYITPSTNLSEFQSRRLLTGVTPLSPTHSGKFVVCLDAIPQGQVGRAVACGVIPAQIYLTPGASSPTLADVVNNQASYLQPAQTGAQVLYCDPRVFYGRPGVVLHPHSDRRQRRKDLVRANHRGAKQWQSHREQHHARR